MEHRSARRSIHDNPTKHANAHQQKHTHTAKKCKSPYRPDKMQSKFSHLENCTVEVTNRERQREGSQINKPTHTHTHTIIDLCIHTHISTHVVKNASATTMHIWHTHRKISNKQHTHKHMINTHTHTEIHTHTMTQAYESQPGPDNMISVKYELWLEKNGGNNEEGVQLGGKKKRNGMQ